METTPVYAVSPEKEFATALRWSRTERAVLIVAVLKKKRQLEYLQELAAALEAGEVPPEPPVVTLTRHEGRVYTMYLAWQRWAAGLRRVGAGAKDVRRSVDEARKVADEAEEEWKLAMGVLEQKHSPRIRATRRS